MSYSIVPASAPISRERPLLWISACLLGQPVRYDGRDKANQIAIELTKYFDHIAICPELEMGMGVPRPSIAWYNDRLLENDSKKDHTAKSAVAKEFLISNLPAPAGAILKSKSPSCGLINVPDHITQVARAGFFAAAVKEAYPRAGLIDENDLINNECFKGFLKQSVADPTLLKDLHLAFDFLA